MLKKLFISNHGTPLFITGLVIFTILNFFSASTMELHFDEAYYWIWAQTASFGYFDHPPLIAWLIKTGQFLFDGELGVRFFTIVLSSFSMIILWRIMRKYSPNALLFWALIYSVCLIQPYSFIATPDAPLFFFTALFFYGFSHYIEKRNFQNAVILAFIIALMIYSKYHAFLLLGLVVMFNLKLLKRFSFWLIIFFTVIYLLPHIFWQIENNFPSFRYHLFESHKTPYDPVVTLRYVVSELALTGPLLGWFFLYILFSIKPGNQLEKSLKYSGIGIFIFFFFSTLGGDFEAHWTLIAIIPLLILSYKYILENRKWQKWVMISGLISFVLLLALRILILTPVAGNIKAFRMFSGNKENAELIKKYAGNTPVLFQDNWIDASLFAYNSNNPMIGNLNSAFYRRNQFDIIDADELLSKKDVVVFTTDSLQFAKPDKIITSRSVLYGKTINDFHSYYNLTLTIKEVVSSLSSKEFIVTIGNPYDDAVNIGSDYGVNASFQIWLKDGKKWKLLSENYISNIQLKPNSSHEVKTKFNIAPDLFKDKEVYLMLKIGELKPIPSKCLIK